ncbi:MAG TPA: exo-alpha-sialidase [Alphaproteobacteria bacterium]|nr:exo-alpha-sialidase [Alphaproteobacteria bacterium]
MPAVRHVSAKNGDVILLVGTMKGAFVLRSNASRKKWDVGGPYSIGSPVYAMAFDQRQGRRRLWWAQQSFRWGTALCSSDDYGKTITEPETYSVKFTPESQLTLKNIWQICLGRDDDPDTMYCGVEPAALFESHDAGKTWLPVEGLLNHPHRPKWQPGGGGLCLHTIVPDPVNPKRMMIAISTAGAYRTDDGGATWQARNEGVRAEFLPEKYPEFGQCVHKIARHPSRPERLFLQNHWGLYRSDDAGNSWKDVANGVPSDFGFCMAAHPHDPDTVYIVPIESDEYRCTPEGKLRVYRTQNAGKSWEPMTRGLRQKDALETILRDSLATDTCDPAGIYFGTRSGKVYGSSDDGKSWRAIIEGLPAVVCVRAAVVGEGRAGSPQRRGDAEKKRAAKSRSARHTTLAERKPAGKARAAKR